KPARVRCRLLGQPRVVRELVGKRGDEELVRAAVALGTNLVRIGTRGADAEQETTRFFGEPRGELVLAFSDSMPVRLRRHVLSPCLTRARVSSPLLFSETELPCLC